MRFDKRSARSLVVARCRGAYRPKAEGLEERILLAIDLGGNTPPNLPAIATVPYGVELAGGQPGGGAGFSVSDVGDVTGDGFDDFVIGGPTVNVVGGQLVLRNSGNAQAYLVFGSKSVNAGNIDWLTLSAVQRVGDLNQLGNSPNAQQNPINGQSGFAFDGITFTTSQSNRSGLGASVAAAGVINGRPSFLIGAPGANDITNTNIFTGRAYLIYGGASLTNLPGGVKNVDLDNSGNNQGVNFVTFTAPSGVFGTGQIGRSVSGAGDLFAENANSIAIGAPFATYNGQSNAGVVFAVSGANLPAVNTTVDLSLLGQNGGRRGVIFGGPNSGANAGFSLANAGSVDAALSTGNGRIPDLLIGAPGAATAYLVYGGPSLIGSATTVGTLNSIALTRIGDPTVTTGAVLGAVFQGTPGDGTGFSVGSAGDFNADGFADVMIGSPNAGGNTGSVTLIYGQAASGSTLKGNIPLANIPATVQSVTFTGNGAGALAGYSVSVVGRINTNNPADDILIGSPGENNNAGAAYLIPGNAGGLTGTFALASAEAQPVAATVLTLSNNPQVNLPSFFGASVSGRPTFAGQRHTADGDLIADFIIGAPGFTVVNGRALDGGVFILEGAGIPIQTPVNNAITTQIGVGQPVGPFVVNATTPANLQIFVFSNAAVTPPFDPVRDINPKTIVVNGVPFPNATIAKDPVDENNDGIEDAIITITPRSSLGLTANTTSLTISGRTLAGSPNANRNFSGTASISVTGAAGGGGGTGTTVTSAGPPIGSITPTTFVPPFGGRFVPAPSSLSVYDYKAIPFKIAYQQYHPLPGFTQRMLNYFLPNKFHYQRSHGNGELTKTSGTSLLGQHVFDTSKYHPGKRVEFTHKVIVLPFNRQHELFAPRYASTKSRLP